LRQLARRIGDAGHDRSAAQRRSDALRPFLMGGQVPMLEAVEVSKRFGPNLALDGISIGVHPGDIYCLLGANGAGKTTLINLFLAFHKPTSGSVRIDGRDVAEHALESKRDIAYIPETVMLYGMLSGV